MAIELFGWIGTVLLTVCTLPQLWLTWKYKQVQGLSHSMIWLWLFGLISMFIYVYNTTQQPTLLANYGINIFIVIILLVGYHRGKR